MINMLRFLPLAFLVACSLGKFIALQGIATGRTKFVILNARTIDRNFKRFWYIVLIKNLNLISCCIGKENSSIHRDIVELN